TNSNPIYLATLGGGIFKSTNKGQSFSPKNVGLTEFNISSIAIDKFDENRIYLGTTYGAIFKSTDGGESWAKIFTVLPSGPIKKIAVNPSNSQVLYVCSENVGMIKSSDGGSSWISINNGLPTSYISTFSLKPNIPDTIVAATDKGLYKTSDGGNNWTLCHGENKNFSDVVFSPADNNLAFAYNYDDHEILRSLNGGTTWEEINPNNSYYLYKMFPDPVDKNILYYVDYSNLFRSLDQGLTFSPIPNPTYNGSLVYIETLTFDPSNHNNLFASSSYGIFTMEISCGTISVSPSSLPDGKEYQDYYQQVSFSGGLSPYSVVLSSGTLPPGLYLEHSYYDYCYISGTPYQSGTYNFNLRISDSLGCFIEKSYTINIA
ncbi:MAG: putative Ig domain-containing protein, partial [Acidobacteria bacterium]|nr:putative Ig domain-containing protein [Acidobacteriota bacterium]